MMRAVAAIAMLGVLAGCTTTSRIQMLEDSGDFDIQPSTSPDYDYVVQMTSRWDVGFDPSIPETRRGLALEAMKAQCPGAMIVGEEVFERGTTSLGFVLREYWIQIRC